MVFDGYGSNNSTKSAEQQRREDKAVSQDMLIDGEMKVVTTQISFFGNESNKSRLIGMIRKEF